MKNQNISIKSFILVLGISISIVCNSQELKPNRKEMRESKKLEMMRNFEAIGSVIESRNFVFEGDMTRNPHKSPEPGQSVIRFDNSRVIIESQNITLPGNEKVISYEIKRWDLIKNTKNLSYILRFYADARETGIEVYLRINPDKSALAQFGGGIHHNEFIGRIRPN
jgi:hypothetical protein